MSRYILKEYGSWGVMTLSFLTGILVSGVFPLTLIPAYIVICLMINSKQAFTLWMRSKGSDRTIHGTVFFAEIVSAALLLLFLAGGTAGKLLPYAAIPAAYLLLNRFAGEHAISTEVSGFAFLATAALVSRLFSSGQVDNRLYLAVALFFTAGVFKVRVQLRKGVLDRTLMAGYLAFTLAAYYAIGAPLIVLLPLAENLVFAVILYKATLRVTGWTEVLKGICFLLLMGLYY